MPRTHDSFLAQVEALTLAIDANARATLARVRSVQARVTHLARMIGVSDDEMLGLRFVGLLPDFVDLAAAESPNAFPYPVAQLVLCQHERWDGKGYPQGLRGEEIPLGARIVSVVNRFDELTTLRPCHSAMSHEAAVALLQHEAGRAFDPAVVRMFVEMCAELEAVAAASNPAIIHDLSIFDATQDDALSDPITGLPNTRFLFTHLARELSRAKRFNSEATLLLMDLNAFKAINASQGRQIGDRALIEIAAVLRSTIGPYDICVRKAGDEFMMVLTGCGPMGAEAVRRQITYQLSTVDLESCPGRRVPLSLSIGTAIFPHDGCSYEDLFTIAVTRMYEEKARFKSLGKQGLMRTH